MPFPAPAGRLKPPAVIGKPAARAREPAVGFGSSDYITDLIAPFPSDQIDLKPGALTKSKDRALAVAYADSRVYQDRLDQVVGPAGCDRLPLTHDRHVRMRDGSRHSCRALRKAD